MIVRDVLQMPELIDKFDWFNDGKDTIAYLKWINRREPSKATEALIAKMEERFKTFTENWWRKLVVPKGIP